MYQIVYKLSLSPLSNCAHATFFTLLKLFLQIQSQLPASSAELERKNEAFLDEIFLQGKYANFQDSHFNYLLNISEAEFNQWKTYLAEIENNKKINFFTAQLFDENISLRYFKIQMERYQLQTLKKYCFFTLSKNLSSLQGINQLPLPKLLKEELTAVAQQTTQLTP